MAYSAMDLPLFQAGRRCRYGPRLQGRLDQPAGTVDHALADIGADGHFSYLVLDQPELADGPAELDPLPAVLH